VRSLTQGSWASFAGIFIVTNLGLLAVGATLPVLPDYVQDELDGSDLEVGIVSGAFAVTGIVCRPIAGLYADRIGRRPTVIAGALLATVAGAMLFVPAGIAGLLVSRFFLGAGEGTVFTAG
jgi:MFS family permease